MQIEADAAARLLVDYWKLLRSYERTVRELPANKAEKVNAQIRYSAHRLEQILEHSAIKLICFDGEPFSPELPVSAVNAEDLEGCEDLIIEKTLEPTLLQGGSVFHTGKVLLKGAS